MTSLISALWLCASSALAQDDDIDPRRLQDITAFTVPEGTWRVGLVHLDYGLSERTSVGIQPALWLLGPNIKAKSTVLEGERLALSAGASRQGVYKPVVAALLGKDQTTAEANVTALDARLSWVISPRWSLHGGYTRMFADVSGELTGNEINRLVSAVVGSDVTVVTGNELYASAEGRLRLNQTNFAAEWRRSARTTWIFESNTYVYASGLLVGTANAGSDTAEAGAGAAAKFSSTLEGFPSVTSVSWQRHWDRFNLRLGIGLPPSNALAYFQAIQFYWLL